MGKKRINVNNSRLIAMLAKSLLGGIDLNPIAAYGYTKRKNTDGLAGFSVNGTEVRFVELGQVTQLLCRPTFSELVCTSRRQPR